MKCVLGIDTSNYTTSAAFFDASENCFQQKMLLPVKKGEVGLRQSDAVFHHTQQLPQVIKKLFSLFEGLTPEGIGVSVRPRDQEDSYMPCFTVGQGLAESLGAILDIPFFHFSHQCGHLAAALYSCQRMDLFEAPFLAFHVSGGTTEGLLVSPDGRYGFHVEIVAQSLDLKAGQAIDRVGRMLGLPFPAGKEMDALSLRCSSPQKVKAVIKRGNCSLSGIENQCATMLARGVVREVIARYCIDSVKVAVEGMTDYMRDIYGRQLPVVYAGGVMSNTIIRNELEAKYGAFFAQPEFSADNAVGVALLAKRALERMQ